jgi:tetratricopeptide (TPR) repeat protein
LKNIFYILLLFCPVVLSAQSPYDRLRAGLEQNVPEAVSIADSCLRVAYHSDSAMFYRSLFLLKKERLTEAKNQIHLLEKKYPDFYLSDYAMALYYFQREDFGRCTNKLNKVLNKNPAHLKSLYNRALVAGLLDDYKAAQEDLTACIVLQPQEAMYYYSRGYWFEIAGKTETAISDYEAALQKNPRLFDAYFGIANCYRLQKNNEKACETIDRAESAGSQVAVDLRQTYCH